MDSAPLDVPLYLFCVAILCDKLRRALPRLDNLYLLRSRYGPSIGLNYDLGS